MKLRKWLSLFLALALMVSLAQRSDMTAFATEPSGTETVDENVPDPEETPADPEDEAAVPEETVPTVTTPAETTPGAATPGADTLPETTMPGADVTPGTTPETTEPGADTTPGTTEPGADTTPGTTEPGVDVTPGTAAPGTNATPDATPGTDAAPDTTTPPEAAPDTITPADKAPDAVLPPEDADNETDSLIQEEQVDVPTVMSLFPYEEKRVSVYLNDYSKEQLAAMPVDTLLDMLLDRDGNKITVPADAEILCGYQKDEDGDVLDMDSYKKVERGGTVDLSYKYDSSSSYQMRLIIGDENQLAKDNVRYIVTVYINLIR